MAGNSVPLGQAGTGAAFALGENKALAKYLENEDYNTQVDRQNAMLAQKAKQDQQKQLYDDYLKNALNVKAGLVFQDIDEQSGKVIEKGKELYQKGVNPWQPYTGNDPKVKTEVEELQRNRLMVEQQAQRRDALQPQLLKEMTSYDPSKHTKRSFDELNAYTKLPASEAFKIPVPTLQPKLQPNAVLDKVKLGKVGEEYVLGNKRIKKEGLQPSVARSAIVDALKLENGVQDFLKEDLGIDGYTIDALEKLPKTLEGIKESAIKEYKGNPRFREELAKKGITSQDQFEQVASEKAIDAFQSKQKWEGFIQSATKNKLAELGSSVSIVNDFTAEDQRMQEENLRLRKLELAKKDEKAKEETPLTQRQQWIVDMREGTPNSGEKLAAYIKGNPEFDPNGKLAIGYDPKDKKILQLDVPARVNYESDNTGEVSIKDIKVPRKKYRLDTTDPNFETQLNEVLNNVTGQRVDIGSSLAQKGNKNKGTQSQMTQSKDSGMVTVTLNGNTGQIPKAKLADFKKKYPNAKVR